MGRGSSGGGGGGRSSSYRPAAKSSPRQPAASRRAPAPAKRGGGFLEAVADGFGFGAGHAAAHRAVDAVVGPRTIQHTTVAAAPADADACPMQTKAFQDCLYSYMTDISQCQIYMDTWAACKRSHPSS